MLVSYADRLGREIGVNGVWGNMGVALSALITGTLAQMLGWRAAFIVPGVVSVAVGIAFMVQVKHEVRTASRAAGAARIGKDEMLRVFAILLVVAFALGLAFNAVTLALPKIIEERVTLFGSSPAVIGAIGFCVYLCGAISQYVIGRLIDHHPLRRLFLPVGFALAPALLLASVASDGLMLAAAVLVVVAIYSQVTINDAMTGKYTSDERRSRAFAARYTITFGVGAVAIGLVTWLHARGGFALTLQVLAAVCVLIALAALAFPRDRAQTPVTAPQPAE